MKNSTMKNSTMKNSTLSVIVKDSGGYICNADNLTGVPVEAVWHDEDVVLITPAQLAKAGITGDIAEREPLILIGWAFPVSSVEIQS